MTSTPSTLRDAVSRPSSAKRMTISALAAQLGMTKGTVSRALNGYPDIAKETRKRVQKAATAAGYVPLSHAQAIRTGRVRSLGLVLQINQHDGHRPFLADFLSGVSQEASAADWTLTVATATSTASTLETLGALARAQKADGFILPRTYADDPRIRFLRAADVPFVLYGRTADLSGCAYYDLDGEGAVQDAVQRLAELGHKRIAYVGGGAGYNYTRLRAQGYLDGLNACGLPFERSYLAGPAVNEAEGASQTLRLLDTPTPPTAIVFAVDRAACGAYAEASRRGLQIGRDLSVISYDGIPEGGLMEPPLSTYRVDTKQAGAALARMLIARIGGEEPENLRELAKPGFWSRGSHGPPPKDT